jgi:CubicO group peptidase (beta-lactamase class C family)
MPRTRASEKHGWPTPFAGWLVLGAVLLQSLSAAHADEKPTAEKTVIQGELGAKLDRAIQRTTGGGFWGVVLVARGGEVILAKGYGFADYANRPNTPDTLFEIASTSKPFTAAAILKLSMEGKLRLRDPISKFFRRVPSGKRGITVHQLLTHTSGIGPEVGIPYTSPFTRDQMVQHVLTPPLKTRPGETFAYCNFGYALLAAIVEVAAGKSFEDYLKEKLFKPAGLVDTGFVQDKALDAKRVSARLSDRTPKATALDWHRGWGYRGMGGVVTTARDLLLWDRALRGNKILDEATKAVAYTPYRDGYACGWQVEKTERNTTRCHHSGGVAGYAVNYVRNLEEDVVVIVLSNGKTNLHEVTRNVERHLFPVPQLTATLDFKSEDLGRLKSVVFPRNTTWRAQKGARSVFLTLHPRGGQRTAGTISLPSGYARKLSHELEQALRQKGSPAAKGPARMEAGFYLMPYVLQDGRLSLEEGLEIQILPRYSGQDENGKPIVDERITLVLVDTRRGQWPVMAKMNVRAVHNLVDGLKKATE